MVPCPFRACKFQTTVYSTYNTYKCREHQTAADYDVSMVVQDVSNVSQYTDIEHGPAELLDENEFTSEASSGTDNLEEQLQYNLSAFFLIMENILHVSQRATQEIIEHICQLFFSLRTCCQRLCHQDTEKNITVLLLTNL